MKNFISILFLVLFAHTSFAMKEGVALRYPVGSPLFLDTGATSVGSVTWVQLTSALSYACSAILVGNTGTAVIKIGKGGSGSEVDLGTTFPLLGSSMIPVELPKGARISLKSMGTSQSSGLLYWSCFQ